MNLHETDHDVVSEKIRDFYDTHPYPPPVDGLEAYRQRWGEARLRRADYHLFWPAKPFREEMDILVAGCGTSQAARHALRQPGARILGIDVSRTSIQETERLKERYDLTNLELLQLPVERVGELNRRFDKIVCTGVLHHLPDPDVGLRALRDVLKRDGALHLMVYAEYGRAGIYMIQDYCRRLGIGISETEITDLAHTLMALPLDHPLARLLAESPDFRRKAALADALLNPQDRAYTVPQLFDLIQGAGLTFGRWQRQAPYLPYCGDLADTPHTERLAQLADREQYAAVELFRGTMLRHSAILYRDDNPETAQSIQFKDKQWCNYIPHRMPKTIVVEEQLPPGAAAVLINQSHTYADIYLPLNNKEKRLIAAINSRRSITEIMRRAAVKHDGRARTFFQKLWWYDQVAYECPG
jgi:2-polyprenyl-3-methyl-5-hydroxy-6-metoxy-1,4-benzoquinol methylase